MSECGCSVHFEACETHKASLEAGEETVHIEVRFDDEYSRVNASNHRVDLERVQRIHLGIDSEPMDFNEATIADMLQDLVDERPYEPESFVLRAVANALRGEDDNHHLVLNQNRPGKWDGPTESEQRHLREMNWLWTLAGWEHNGMKTEAGVARIAEIEGVSRASVFAALKRAEQYLEDCWSLRGTERFGPRPLHLTNPRPAKKRKP